MSNDGVAGSFTAIGTGRVMRCVAAVVLLVLLGSGGADAKGCRFSVQGDGSYGPPKSGSYCSPF